MKRWAWAVAVMVVAAGCTQNDKAAPPARAQIRKVSGATMEVVPNEGQFPYCLLFTVSEKGIIRQLTMTRENRSIKCDPGRPIANTSFRVPTQEGKVKVYIIFSDQRIQAGSVAQQLYELRDRPRVTGFDFRLPGQASVESLEFIPEEGGAPVTGGVIGAGGELANGEAGSAPGQDGATEDMTGAMPEGMDAGVPASDAGT
jgi:hypothetical protein